MFFSKQNRLIHSVLVVEDEPLVAFDNEHFLGTAGYRVVATVADYDAVVSALEHEVPDLIVADIKLQGDRDGMDVARLAQERGIPVIFVTGNCPMDARDLAVGCLAKPYSQRDLLQSIRVTDAVLRGKAPVRVPPGFTVFAVR
jgi:CheY-like chemotaxis protein